MAPQDPTHDPYEELRSAFARLVADHRIGGRMMEVRCSRLTAEEAIGKPKHDDYPIVRGREFMVAARMDGAEGQAFTDTWLGDYKADLNDVVNLTLDNNYTRAVFIASLNAVCRSLGLVEGTIHCKDDDPIECADKLVEHVLHRCPTAKRVLLVGCQPRMVEVLAHSFDLRVNDLDAENIGTQKSGVTISGPDQLAANLEWADCAVVTGTTVVNGTSPEFHGKLPTIYYGVTIAGVAYLFGLDRFCHCGR